MPNVLKRIKRIHKKQADIKNIIFKSERHNTFTEEIRKMALSSNDDKKMQSIDSIRNICTWNEQRSYMQERKN